MKPTKDALMEIMAVAGQNRSISSVELLFMKEYGGDGINEHWTEQMEFVVLLDAVALAFGILECDAEVMACGEPSIAVQQPNGLYAKFLHPDAWMRTVAQRAKAFVEAHSPMREPADNPLIQLECTMDAIQGWIADAEPIVARTREAVRLVKDCAKFQAIAAEWIHSFLEKELAGPNAGLLQNIRDILQESNGPIYEMLQSLREENQDGVAALSMKIEDTHDAVTESKNRARSSSDLVKCFQKVDEYTTPQHGASLGIDAAIAKAWKAVPRLPQNLSLQRKKSDYNLWKSLKTKLGRSPTEAEYEAARKPIGRPKTKKTSAS